MVTFCMAKSFYVTYVAIVIFLNAKENLRKSGPGRRNCGMIRSSRQHLSTKSNGGSEASNKIANCGMIRSSSQHLALILYYMLLMLTVMLLLAAAHEGIVMDGPNTQVPT